MKDSANFSSLPFTSMKQPPKGTLFFSAVKQALSSPSFIMLSLAVGLSEGGKKH